MDAILKWKREKKIDNLKLSDFPDMLQLNVKIKLNTIILLLI
jgi:hypothetical protein